MFCGFRSRKLLAAAVAAGLLGIGGGAWAQAHRHHGYGAERMFGRLDKIRAELKLNGQQEALWKKAEAQSRETFRGMRDAGRGLRDKMLAGIDKPGADLKQLAALGEELRAQAQASRKQVREAWFAVYDALDAGQKEQVRQYLKGRLEQFGRGWGRR